MQAPLQQGIKRRSHPLPTKAIDEAAVGMGRHMNWKPWQSFRTNQDGGAEGQMTNQIAVSITAFPTCSADYHRSTHS